VILHLRDDGVYANGLPTPDEYRRCTDDEAELIAELERDGVDCLKVGNKLYGAMRDIVFQVENTAAFMKALGRWRISRNDREAELRESEGWDFFDDKIRPKPEHRKWIENNHLVIELLKAGSSREVPHLLDHCFRGQPAALDCVEDQLKRAGFASERRERERLLTTQELVLDPDEITTWTLRFEALAYNSGASYDGWGARVLR
jgi:hypothetical protein